MLHIDCAMNLKDVQHKLQQIGMHNNFAGLM